MRNDIWSEELLEQADDEIDRLRSENEDLAERIDELMDEIDELKKHEWISVKDITPDDDGEVLACYGKDVFIAHFEGDGWVVYVQAEDDCLYQQSVKVSHWIPLPEPPEK